MILEKEDIIDPIILNSMKDGSLNKTITLKLLENINKKEDKYKKYFSNYSEEEIKEFVKICLSYYFYRDVCFDKERFEIYKELVDIDLL